MFSNNQSRSCRGGFQASELGVFIAGRQGFLVFIFLVGILLIVSSVGYSIGFAAPATIRIPQDYSTIQADIDAALSGDIVTDTSTDPFTLTQTASNTPLTTLTFDQNAFRIRTDDSVGLNFDSDWAGALNENVSLWPDTEFRIRFEVEVSGGSLNEGFELWYSRDGGAYAIVPNNATPHAAGSNDGQKTVQAVPSAQYTDLDATTNLLDGSSDTFIAGTGNHDNAAPAVSFSDSPHTELEWTIIIRKLYDDNGHNPDGTTFDFRVRKAGGIELDTYTYTPRVTVLNKPGHIGGTVIETPMRYFVVDNDGNFYYLCEYSDTNNNSVMMKSMDGGTSWNPVDVTGASTSSDLEAGDMDLRGNTIYVTLQGPGSAQTVRHHRFNVSTHPTNPDIWALIDEEVDTAPNPANQNTAIVQRSLTTVIAYRGDPISSKEQIYYRIRSGGSWGSELQLDSETGVDFKGVGMVRDSTNKIHFVYTASDGTNGYIYLRTLSTDNSLEIRQTIHSEVGLQSSKDKVYITPPFVWNDGGTERVGIGFRKESDLLFFRSWNASTEVLDPEESVSDNTVVPSGADSHTTVADIVADDATGDLYVLYGEKNTEDMFYDTRLEGGTWGIDTEEHDIVNVDWIRAKVFAHSAINGGAKVLGYIWDDGSDGGVGKTRYDERMLVEANVAPIANDDTAITSQSTSKTVDVAANDSDPNGNLDPASANTDCTICSATSNGALVNNGDGTLTYTPDPQYQGPDSFVYEICDTEPLCDTATVTITVTVPNDPPVANDDSASTPEDTFVTVDVAANDTDPDGNLDPASANTTCASCAEPENGTLVNDGDGAFTYLTSPDFNGAESFVYEICDVLGLCDTAAVSLTITPVVDPPIANNDNVATTAGTPKTIDAAANDHDPDGDLDPASANTDCATCSGPSMGTLVNNGDGTFIYTSNPDFDGTDSFVYEVCDISSMCDTATVSITVAGTIFEVRVAASSDDAEERVSGGVSLSSSDLELVFDSGGDQVVGMRFNGINIPPGAIISNALIQFQVDEINAVATSLTFQGEDVDNAATFIDSNWNVSSRPRTAAAVAWSPVAWSTRGEAGVDQQTPDISSVIQEIVNRPGWMQNNSLVVIISGTGERTAEAYDGDQAGAPLLRVEYMLGNTPQRMEHHSIKEMQSILLPLLRTSKMET